MLTDLQLKSALTNEQIVTARTKSILPGDPDPVQEEINAAVAKVETYTGGYIVSPFLLTGYARDIAAHQVAKRLSTTTDSQVRAFDRALKEIEDIRDGKFPNLKPAPGAASGKVLHGGRGKVI